MCTASVGADRAGATQHSCGVVLNHLQLTGCLAGLVASVIVQLMHANLGMVVEQHK
jgi:hypothetical protein